MIENNITIYILVLLNMILTIIGYIFGRFSSNKGVDYINQSNIKNTKKQKQTIVNIDDTKFVTDIKTDNLEKKYDQLGEVKHSQDKIGESVNKLKSMKG